MVTKEEIDFIKKIKGRTITDVSTTCPIDGKNEVYLIELDFNEDDYYFTLDDGTVMRVWSGERGGIDLIKSKKE